MANELEQDGDDPLLGGAWMIALMPFTTVNDHSEGGNVEKREGVGSFCLFTAEDWTGPMSCEL